MEGSFADATNNHRFKRSRWTGLWRQRIQDWLIAAVQNIRILLRHGPGWVAGVLGGSAGLLEAFLRLIAADAPGLEPPLCLLKA